MISMRKLLFSFSIIFALNFIFSHAQIDTPTLIKLHSQSRIKQRFLDELAINTQRDDLNELLNEFNLANLLVKLDDFDFYNAKVNYACSEKLSIWRNSLKNREQWALNGTRKF
jgi:hypothetical protein